MHPVELPGRGRRRAEPPCDRIEDLVHDLRHALDASPADAPFAFFGHSMGALVAFELARALRREGRRGPVHLFVSGCAAPQRPRTRRALSALPPAELVAELRRLNGMSREVLENPELCEIVLPAIRNDFALCEQYAFTPEAPLACPITALGGTADDHARREALGPWTEHTSSRFVVRVFEGDHFYLQRQERPLLEWVLRDLLASLPATGPRAAAT